MTCLSASLHNKCPENFSDVFDMFKFWQAGVAAIIGRAGSAMHANDLLWEHVWVGHNLQYVSPTGSHFSLVFFGGGFDYGLRTQQSCFCKNTVCCFCRLALLWCLHALEWSTSISCGKQKYEYIDIDILSTASMCPYLGHPENHITVNDWLPCMPAFLHNG